MSEAEDFRNRVLARVATILTRIVEDPPPDHIRVTTQNVADTLKAEGVGATELLLALTTAVTELENGEDHREARELSLALAIGWKASLRNFITLAQGEYGVTKTVICPHEVDVLDSCEECVDLEMMLSGIDGDRLIESLELE